MVEPRNQFNSRVRNLYDTLLKSQKEESEQQFNSPVEDSEDFYLTKIEISVSNSLHNDFTSEDKTSQVPGELKKPKQTRRRLSNSVKDLLENIFLLRPSPNRRERELIAKKCGVTPLQIRVWVCCIQNSSVTRSFTN